MSPTSRHALRWNHGVVRRVLDSDRLRVLFVWTALAKAEVECDLFESLHGGFGPNLGINGRPEAGKQLR